MTFNRRFTFEEVFGQGSYQDSEKVIISKAALSADSAQSLLLALLSKCLVNGFLTGNGLSVTGNGQAIEYNNSYLYYPVNVLFTRNQLRSGYFVQILKIKVLVPSDTELDLNQL